MTPEQFKARAQAEAAVKAMAQGQQLDADALRGCLMVAAQMGRQLNLPLTDVQVLLAEETKQWVEYEEMKKRVLARRKEQGK